MDILLEINAVAATNFQNYKPYLQPFLYKPKVKVYWPVK